MMIWLHMIESKGACTFAKITLKNNARNRTLQIKYCDSNQRSNARTYQSFIITENIFHRIIRSLVTMLTASVTQILTNLTESIPQIQLSVPQILT